MDAIVLIREQATYNKWANRQLIGWLQQQQPACYEQQVSASYSSVNMLLQHLLEAERYYLSVLQNQKVTYGESMTTDQIFVELMELDQALIAWLLPKKAVSMAEEIVLKRSAFTERYTVASLLTHLLNHATYHRGQLVSMRHQLGIPPPPKTDYYRFLLSL